MFVHLDGWRSRNVRAVFLESSAAERVQDCRIGGCVAAFLRLLGKLRRVSVLRPSFGPLLQEITPHSLHSGTLSFCRSFHLCPRLLALDCSQNYFRILLRIGNHHQHYLCFRDSAQASQRKLLFILWPKLAVRRVIYCFYCLLHNGQSWIRKYQVLAFLCSYSQFHKSYFFYFLSFRISQTRFDFRKKR